MAIHPSDCTCDDSLGCQLRRSRALQLNAGAAKSTVRGRPRSNSEYNGWERGYAYVERPGGARMPILKDNGSRMRVKEASERAPEIRALEQRQAAERMKENA